MKKILGLTLVFMMVAAGAAWAVDVTTSGSYYVRGKWLDNVELADDSDGYGVLDHELDLRAKFAIEDQTALYMRMEIHDENFDHFDSSVNGRNTNNLDDNIEIEEVYFTHNMGPGQWRLGLMGAGAWANDFGNVSVQAYRLRYDLPTDFAKFIMIYQKGQEAGSAADGDDNDSEWYILGIVSKIGFLDVLPLFVFYDTHDADSDQFTIDLALNANFDNWGWQFEVNWDMIDVAGDDYDVWGGLLDLWFKAGAAKIGLIANYTEFDDDSGRSKSNGDDVDGAGGQIWGNEVMFGPNDPDAIDGATYFALYLDFAVTERFSVGPHLGFIDSNYDDGSMWDGADAWELSFDGSYKVTDAVTYSFGAGVGELDYGQGFDDPDSIFVLWHRLKVAF